MLIISKITHKKNSPKRTLQQPFEVINLCKFLIVNGFENFQIQNCKKYAKCAIMGKNLYLDHSTIQKNATFGALSCKKNINVAGVI